MALNILIGSHGVGKSTLLKEISKITNDVFVTDGFSRPIKRVGNKTSLSPSQQQNILNEMTIWAFENYLEQTCEVISTRSPIDAIVYSQLYTPYTANTKEIEQKFLERKLEVKNYFYIPIEFDIVDDGERYIDKKDQKKIDDLFLKFIEDNKLPVIVIKGTIEERVATVLKQINWDK